MSCLTCVIASEQLDETVDLRYIAGDRTVGYSGSDLQALCSIAAQCALKEAADTARRTAAPDHAPPAIRPLQRDDFEEGLLQGCITGAKAKVRHSRSHSAPKSM